MVTASEMGWILPSTVKHLNDLGDTDGGFAEREYEAIYELLEKFISLNCIASASKDDISCIFMEDEFEVTLKNPEWGRTVRVTYTDNETVDKVAERAVALLNNEIEAERDEILRELYEAGEL